MKTNTIAQKIGILGGGQLGKMLCQAGSKLGLNISILERDHTFPAASVCTQFACGDITNYDDVFQFGKDMDVITIEIENVNVDALEALEKIGKKVYPQPRALRTIRDKGLQKSFYTDSNLPTSDFRLFNNAKSVIDAINAGIINYPFVQKSRTEGYDGKGVQIVRSEKDLDHLFDVPSLVEDIVDIEKEIAVIVARTPSGNISTFQAVEMYFHPTANLVEYLFCPSSISASQEQEVTALAKEIAVKMGICGLLAVEFFVDKQGNILINEVAPRPHNSGHHTIEACISSQYEMHLRAILDLPLGDTSLIHPAVMVNLLGEEGHSGPTYYEGLEKCLKISGVHPHLYGKKETKPFRKMGHVTIVNKQLDTAIVNAKTVQKTLKVKAI